MNCIRTEGYENMKMLGFTFCVGWGVEYTLAMRHNKRRCTMSSGS